MGSNLIEITMILSICRDLECDSDQDSCSVRLPEVILTGFLTGLCSSGWMLVNSGQSRGVYADLVTAAGFKPVVAAEKSPGGFDSLPLPFFMTRSTASSPCQLFVVPPSGGKMERRPP